MSTTAELNTIFTRISQRVDSGTENLNVLLRIFTKRAEIEDKISELYKSCLPDKYDQTDPFLMTLVEMINKQATMHAKFAQEVRGGIIVPQTRFVTTVREKQRNIQNAVRRNQGTVSKVQKDYDNAVHDLEQAKAALSTVPPNKQASQQQKIQKYAILAKQRQDEIHRTITLLHTSAIPTLHADFSEFDSSRLVHIQNSVSKLADLNKMIDEADMKLAIGVLTKVNNMDGADRSSRYVTRAFNPSSKSLTDETELYAYGIENYNSEDPADLQFVRGDKIRVLQQHNSGWWDGELNGKRGLFPRSFVTLGRDELAKNDPIGAVFLCTKDFTGTSGGEIQLLSGDLVYVDYVIGQKCSGRNLRTNNRGFFPLDALESKIN
ncbi:Variant SH3 domain containing protein [Trichomonas vaginalis G3]|uniref:Variant SH3 domain containing protein n=1 Tax=Trichomonas vaginalis (strain ATCC PRA-98 / G3) TaxID=412133 RepID=A2FPV5_TRIV3|nr:peptidyl-tyrosine autophosphorylation [Trichomonas vaginalis G3]EAX93059.1 Variant SH3 domain containing protein [Trichomonas vaginalis G3]KAI5500712.1 peptidyl-tyrosine autophosphorylation [Trichomonas vaginalis G3]|eukprot:XP_001305989.1 Variant SH3 domain containing protein [Trichomonas vaginalis G3]